MMLAQIPQGCYGILDSDTHYAGLYTTGLSTCTLITVHGSGPPGCVILCHADALTNLSDEQHGIRAWIERARGSGGRVAVRYETLDEQGPPHHQEVIQSLVRQYSGDGSINFEVLSRTSVERGILLASGDIISDDEGFRIERANCETEMNRFIKFGLDRDAAHSSSEGSSGDFDATKLLTADDVGVASLSSDGSDAGAGAAANGERCEAEPRPAILIFNNRHLSFDAISHDYSGYSTVVEQLRVARSAVESERRHDTTQQRWRHPR